MTPTPKMIEAGARGIRMYCAEREVATNGEITPDPMFEASGYAEACLRAALAAQLGEWQPITTAPKDGTHVDLFFPGVRGRQIDWFWEASAIDPSGSWVHREPTWDEYGELLPEHRWNVHTFPNEAPTHWRPLPAPPQPESDER